MQGRLIFFFLLFQLPLLCQVITTTQEFTEHRWVINTNLTLPAAKFHIAEKRDYNGSTEEVKGYLELFSSFGVGLSLNFGEALFVRNVNTGDIMRDETEFSNLLGVQLGVLYSSKVNDQDLISINEFSLYGGLNILDLQVGVGYDLGVQRKNATRWFMSVAYGIPIYKLTGRASYIFKKRKKRN